MKRLTSFIIFGCLFLAGCITEDRSRCTLSNVALSFVYFGDDENKKDKFSKVSEKVDVFVYDEAGDKVAQYKLEKSDLNIRQGMGLRLDPGKYTIIFWVNAMSNTVIMNAHSLKEASVCNPGFCLGGPLVTNDKLYYGKSELTVPANGTVEETVTFLNVHISLEIYIRGEGVTDTTVPIVEIDKLYPQYDFFLNPINDDETGGYLRARYYPLSAYDADKSMGLSFTDVLAFEQQNEVEIYLKDNADSKPIVELKLAKFLEDNNIDVESRQERTIPILFTLNKDLSVDITVPEWGQPPIKPEI